ncbi:MAG: B12-binding domain-containing radical SAM protein [Candidatus Bathyarchaeota archaeon]|nr:B12-binding domain-containing radical SAM protein [Candidatus Bathyarchaeum sp.]
MTTAPPVKSPWGISGKLPPLGLSFVAASLEQAGFQVQVLDNYNLKKPIDQVKLEIQRLNPEIVGITCGSVTYGRCIETAQAIKEVNPSCKVVVGGWQPTYMPESLFQHPEIDYLVMGEGEQAIVELAKNLAKSEDKSAISKIAGVAYKDKEKTIKNAPTFIQDLDQVPFPARHLLPMHIYDRKIPYLNANLVDTMNVIRGCPYNCAYCETKKLWGSKVRAFSPHRVVEEIKHLTQNFGSNGVYFVGDNFTINKKRTAELCSLIKKEKLDIKWGCDARVDQISRELLREMKTAGCQTIWLGVESGVPRILEKLNKKITIEQITQTFKLCKEEGIRTACSFMLGIPGETVNDMKASFKFARKLDPDWCQFNTYVAVPGSKLYDEVIENGLYDRVEDFVTYVKTKEFDYEMVSEIQQRFHMTFNRSPKRILRKIREDGIISVLKKSVKYI